MSISGTNGMVKLGTSTALIPVKDFTIDMQPKPVENPTFTNDQIQEGLRMMSQGITITMQAVVEAFTTAFQPVFDAFKQYLSNWAIIYTKSKHHSKQTQAFLATIRKEPAFTPHAHKRRRNQRRMHVYQMKANRA